MPFLPQLIGDYRRVQYLDSHTGGEPTRLILAGGPDLGAGPLAERRLRLDQDALAWCRALIDEPRGHDVIVGAFLVPPHDPSCDAAVIFFNNVGSLGMCGHGTIGVAESLRALGRWHAGVHRLETPVGVVEVTLGEDGGVSLRNVPSYRWRADVAVTLDNGDVVTGDIAWGGNWFFLTPVPAGLPLRRDAAGALTAHAQRVRQALDAMTWTLPEPGVIDHVELVGAPHGDGHGRNFVLCPGGAYDRSPCGTGTSAKMACLAASGEWPEQAWWRQESVIGSVFEARYTRLEGPGQPVGAGPRIQPEIKGRAHLTGLGELLLDPQDGLCWGL